MSDSKNWKEGGKRWNEHDQYSSSGSSSAKRRCDDRGNREESSRSSDNRSHHRSGKDQDDAIRGSDRNSSPDRKSHRKRRSSRDRSRTPDKHRHSHHRDRTKVPRRESPERESERSRDRRHDRDSHNGRRRDSHVPYHSSERSRVSRSGTNVRGEEDKYNSTPLPQEIPKPTANAKLVEEVEKRKLLFSKKEKPAEASSSVWEKTKLSQDSDGKLTAKFKRLMGIKDECSGSSLQDSQDETSKVGTKKAEYFADLEKQYEVARATTHTQRGVGFGFSTSRILPR